MSYEKYFIDVSGYEKIDIYRYLELLPGDRGHAIEHALKKLALCGVRTGGKSLEKDITEARDTLNRWLEMREEDKRIVQGKIKQLDDQNKEWPSDERIDTIGQNGNEGEHYGRKEYRDLERPETWRAGDIVKINGSQGELTGALIKVRSKMFTMFAAGDLHICHFRLAQSVEARS